MNNHPCLQCEKTYKTRAGLWKHVKAKHQVDNEETIEISESTGEGESSPASFNPPVEEAPSPVGTEEPEEPEWLSWNFENDENATDVIPSALNSILDSPQMGSSKLSKAQRAALEKQNHALLKLGLTTVDILLSKYGSVVSEDPSFSVNHDEKTKDLVANAQYRYLEEKGLFLTNYLSSGAIALSLTSWYVAAPMVRIRKHAKKRFFKVRILSRLPLIGRFFKSKEVHVIAQNTDEVKA